MKISDIFIYAGVLWTLVQSRNVGRLERSLDVEGRGSNLTHKQQQEVIHSDVLQHFSTTPSSALEIHSDHSTPSLTKDLPYLPEDINIQSLKNDDHFHLSYSRRISIDKDNPDSDSSHEQNNKTLKTDTNDVIYFNYNQTGASSSTTSEISISHSSYEHLSTSVVYDEDDNNEQTQGSQTSSLTTETSKVGLERKNLETKKKEKGKKEIPDSATVPTDSNGAGKIEKPFKDNIINVKLKDKNKDSIPEALDDRRSTTARISSSSSVSLSDHDNNKFLSSLEMVKINSPNTDNKEVVNQSVNSVININGVNNDSIKKPKVKASIKRTQDISDMEIDNTASSSVQLSEDTARNTVPVVNLNLHTTPSSLDLNTTPVEKVINQKPYPPVRRSQLTEAFPTKSDGLSKVTIPSSTTIIKPSIAFKQQIANKLKGLETVPTVAMAATDDEPDESQGKSGKSSTKFTLRKKPKLEHASLPEMKIPSTATAWSLASLKSSAETLQTSQKPESPPEPLPTTDSTSSPRVTTIVPVSRVKSFVPWSTRLMKKASTIPPATPSTDELNSSEYKDETSDSDFISSQITNFNPPTSSEASKSSKVVQPSTTEAQQSVIRTTMELERNLPETSVNIIQPLPNDVMVRDQSSPSPKELNKVTVGSTEKHTDLGHSVETSNLPLEPENNSENESQVVENVIETKQTSDGNETKSKKEDKRQQNTISNTTNNRMPQNFVNENVNEVKYDKENHSSNDVILEGKTNSTLEVADKNKFKNISDQHDSGISDLGADNTGEEGKSAEDSDEEERQNHTTTLPPIFEPFETTTMMDLDEDVEGESDRDEEELPILTRKTNQTFNERPNETFVPSVSNASDSKNVNGTGTYVTSFDIISKENTSQVVTRTPSEGDINWYNVDTKQINESVEETSQKPISAEVTTTVAMETTIEPETTTETTKQEQETTIFPVITDTVTTMMPTTEAIVTQSSTVSVPFGDISDPDSSVDNVEDSSSCVRIVFHVSPSRLCRDQQQLRKSIAGQLTLPDISWEQIVVLTLQQCNTNELSTQDQNLTVELCFFDEDKQPSPAIQNEFLKLYTARLLDSSFPIVDLRMDPPLLRKSDEFDNVLAAIILSVIAAICLVLLGVLLVIVRKRQGRFNYGQRCTPVSLDDYSLDNISVYNSVRRKGALRASKRSYGNPGFEDPGAPTHPINFAGLANFSSDRGALDEEFHQIPMITVKADELPAGAENKNRYANVIPLPETRVILQTKQGSGSLEEYINANYVKGPKGQEKLYIACQAPLQATVEDFWKMVWQQQTKVILMLTALSENGVEKCADYLPQLEITDCHRMFGDFQVTLKKHEVREKYIISSLQLKNLETNLWREVTHLWYMSWPAQGVPEDCSSMIAFLIEARSYMRGAQGPTVVHCSPGTGRTGTVIAIDLCIRDFETIRSVDIPKTVYALRRDRAGAVQTKDQYAFIYQVLNLYATKLTGGALDSI